MRPATNNVTEANNVVTLPLSSKAGLLGDNISRWIYLEKTMSVFNLMRHGILSVCGAVGGAQYH
jgi:hypothetical protein